MGGKVSKKKKGYDVTDPKDKQDEEANATQDQGETPADVESEVPGTEQVAEKKDVEAAAPELVPEKKEGEGAAPEQVAEKKDGEAAATEQVPEKKDEEAAAPKLVPEKKDGEGAAPEQVPEKKDGEGAAPEQVPEKKDGDAAATEQVPDKKGGETAATKLVPEKKDGETAAPEQVPEKKDGEVTATEQVPEKKDGEVSAPEQVSEKKDIEVTAPKQVSENKDRAAPAPDQVTSDIPKEKQKDEATVVLPQSGSQTSEQVTDDTLAEKQEVKACTVEVEREKEDDDDKTQKKDAPPSEQEEKAPLPEQTKDGKKHEEDEVESKPLPAEHQASKGSPEEPTRPEPAMSISAEPAIDTSTVSQEIVPSQAPTTELGVNVVQKELKSKESSAEDKSEQEVCVPAEVVVVQDVHILQEDPETKEVEVNQECICPMTTSATASAPPSDITPEKEVTPPASPIIHPEEVTIETVAVAEESVNYICQTADHVAEPKISVNEINEIPSPELEEPSSEKAMEEVQVQENAEAEDKPEPVVDHKETTPILQSTVPDIVLSSEIEKSPADTVPEIVISESVSTNEFPQDEPEEVTMDEKADKVPTEESLPSVLAEEKTVATSPEDEKVEKMENGECETRSATEEEAKPEEKPPAYAPVEKQAKPQEECVNGVTEPQVLLKENSVTNNCDLKKDLIDDMENPEAVCPAVSQALDLV